MLIPDQDLAGLNAASHHPQTDEGGSLCELVSDKGLNELRWGEGEGQRADRPYLFAHQTRLVGGSICCAINPTDLISELWPPTLWQAVSVECDRYCLLNGRTHIRQINTQEVICYAGQLITRSLHPWSSGLRNNWRISTERPFKPGTFRSLHIAKSIWQIGSVLAPCRQHCSGKWQVLQGQRTRRNIAQNFQQCLQLGTQHCIRWSTIKALGRGVFECSAAFTTKHDYLRIAHYSVQTSHVFKKWYMLFFAMIDMSLVKSYIAWKIKMPSTMWLSHGVFQERVALGLVNKKNTAWGRPRSCNDVDIRGP